MVGGFNGKLNFLNHTGTDTHQINVITIIDLSARAESGLDGGLTGHTFAASQTVNYGALNHCIVLYCIVLRTYVKQVDFRSRRSLTDEPSVCGFHTASDRSKQVHIN